MLKVEFSQQVEEMLAYADGNADGIALPQAQHPVQMRGIQCNSGIADDITRSISSEEVNVVLKLDDKKAIVSEVSDVAKNAVSLIAAEYSGLTVDKVTGLRKSARESGVYLRVVRNTLAKRALADTQFACMNDALVGPLMLAFSKEDPGAAARLLKAFAKENEQLKVMAVAFENQLFPAENIDKLANLPTRDQAIALLMSVMLAPMTKLVRTLAEPHAKLVRTLAAIRDAKKLAS